MLVAVERTQSHGEGVQAGVVGATCKPADDWRALLARQPLGTAPTARRCDESSMACATRRKLCHRRKLSGGRRNKRSITQVKV